MFIFFIGFWEGTRKQRGREREKERDASPRSELSFARGSREVIFEATSVRASKALLSGRGVGFSFYALSLRMREQDPTFVFQLDASFDLSRSPLPPYLLFSIAHETL